MKNLFCVSHRMLGWKNFRSQNNTEMTHFISFSGWREQEKGGSWEWKLHFHGGGWTGKGFSIWLKTLDWVNLSSTPEINHGILNNFILKNLKHISNNSSYPIYSFDPCSGLELQSQSNSKFHGGEEAWSVATWAEHALSVFFFRLFLNNFARKRISTIFKHWMEKSWAESNKF